MLRTSNSASQAPKQRYNSKLMTAQGTLRPNTVGDSSRDPNPPRWLPIAIYGLKAARPGNWVCRKGMLKPLKAARPSAPMTNSPRLRPSSMVESHKPPKPRNNALAMSTAYVENSADTDTPPTAPAMSETGSEQARMKYPRTGSPNNLPITISADVNRVVAE